MSQQELIDRLHRGPVAFATVMAFIDSHYRFEPTAFHNGEQVNEAGSNNGSCKIFAFAQLAGLTEAATLNAFGDYYVKDVLGNPDGSDHGNIRNFMRFGWAGIAFDGAPLQPQ
ncbi:HopJ type III effector protein [Spongiibacter taiwanensis]|uniref:HopJ type III effector protein n=1 Tax=Spongiibacter taiwanensis TaxID=1748242 RepID=UPI002036007E|nr:HopJ type III effector protein [Spongiibacter taiwanensis]USA44465.1 HopJ type III effector protein [Spongiibacter taiwanensis]